MRNVRFWSRGVRLATGITVAATAAVAMVTLPASAAPAHPATPMRTAAPAHPAAAAHPAVAPAHAAVTLPTYTLAIASSQMSLTVYKTSTGAAVATLKAPAGQPFEQLASGGTATSFLIAAGTNATVGCNTWYYKFQLSATGQPSKLTLLRKMPTGWLSTGVAASPGGGTFAYTAVHCFATSNPIGVIGTTGQAGNRSWTYDLSEDTPNNLAVSADGETLAFQGYVGATQDGLLLNTDSTSTTVMGASRVVITTVDPVSVEISTDAKTIYACANSGTANQIASYSAATGKQLKVLRTLPARAACTLSAGATGRFLVASITVGSSTSLVGFDTQAGTSVTLKIHPNLPIQQGTLVTW